MDKIYDQLPLIIGTISALIFIFNPTTVIACLVILGAIMVASVPSIKKLEEKLVKERTGISTNTFINLIASAMSYPRIDRVNDNIYIAKIAYVQELGSDTKFAIYIGILNKWIHTGTYI
jgi:hypothetical protein